MKNMMAPLAPARVQRTRTLVEGIGDQGDVNVFSTKPPFDVGVISWLSEDGHPLPVKLTFGALIYKNGGTVTLPKAQTLTPGLAAAIIEYSAEGSVATTALIDWPTNGRSVTLVASRLQVRLRTRNPLIVTQAGQALFPVQVSDAGAGPTSRDFAPLTYTDEIESFVPASPGVLSMVVPLYASAVLMNPRTPAVQMTITFFDELANETLIQRTGGATAATERPESPTPIPAGAQRLEVAQTGAAIYEVRPVWLIDLP